MKLLNEHDDYDLNDIVLIESLTYYKLEFLTNDWILKTLYISKPQISMQKSMTIIQLTVTCPTFGSCAAPRNPLGQSSLCLTILSNTRRTGHSPQLVFY